MYRPRGRVELLPSIIKSMLNLCLVSCNAQISTTFPEAFSLHFFPQIFSSFCPSRNLLWQNKHSNPEACSIYFNCLTISFCQKRFLLRNATFFFYSETYTCACVTVLGKQHMAACLNQMSSDMNFLDMFKHLKGLSDMGLCVYHHSNGKQ